MRAVIFICILALCIAGTSAIVTAGSSRISTEPVPGLEEDTVTIFLTGNTLGSLKPCGCVEDQIGGFDRRGAVLEKVPDDRKVVVDTGNFLYSETAQDFIKFGIIFQALAMLDYDVVNLDENDFRIAQNLEMLEDAPFSIISGVGATGTAVSAKFTKTLKVGAVVMPVTVASVLAKSEQMGSLRELFGNAQAKPAINILIIDNYSVGIVKKVAAAGVVDVLVCPTSADEPRVVEAQRKKPLVVSVGQFGKYLGKLTARATSGGKLNLEYSKVAIDEKLPQSQDLVQLYQDYQFIVKEEDLLEKFVRMPLPDNLEYMGSNACILCHGYEYEKWETKRHGHAYQTLVGVGSQYDPECIVCHVVGFEYETGFINEKSDEGLRNVGCEVCHGPRSEHVNAAMTGSENTKIVTPKRSCSDCHTYEHSPNYDKQKAEYLEKIVHWREPNNNHPVQ